MTPGSIWEWLELVTTPWRSWTGLVYVLENMCQAPTIQNNFSTKFSTDKSGQGLRVRVSLITEMQKHGKLVLVRTIKKMKLWRAAYRARETAQWVHACYASLVTWVLIARAHKKPDATEQATVISHGFWREMGGGNRRLQKLVGQLALCTQKQTRDTLLQTRQKMKTDTRACPLTSTCMP